MNRCVVPVPLFKIDNLARVVREAEVSRFPSRTRSRDVTTYRLLTMPKRALAESVQTPFESCLPRIRYVPYLIIHLNICLLTGTRQRLSSSVSAIGVHTPRTSGVWLGIIPYHTYHTSPMPPFEATGKPLPTHSHGSSPPFGSILCAEHSTNQGQAPPSATEHEVLFAEFAKDGIHLRSREQWPLSCDPLSHRLGGWAEGAQPTSLVRSQPRPW